jgi:hypothetical protein
LIVSRAKDNAYPVLTQDSFSVGVSSNYFVYDSVKPTSTVSVPVNGGKYGGPGNELGTLYATAYDSDYEYINGPSAIRKRISKVYFAIREADSGLYWNVSASTFNSTTPIYYEGHIKAEAHGIQQGHQRRHIKMEGSMW